MARSARRSDGLNESYSGPTKGSNLAYVQNSLKFSTSDWNGMTLSSVTDAATDTGFTLANGTLYESLWDGAGAAAAMVLPEAKVGALTVFRFVAQADGGANITFTTGSGDFFATQHLVIPVRNNGDGLTDERKTIRGTSWNPTVVNDVGANEVVIASTHNTLIIASTATNNQTAIGAELGFFCDTDGFWRLSFLASELGSGIINATFATSTV